MTERDEQIYEFGSFQLRAADGVLLKNGKVVSLTPKALKILLMLVKRHGQMIEKEEILNEVWADTFVEESSVMRNISVLRKILQEESDEIYIETFHRRGYRFVAPLKNIAAPFFSQTAQQIAVLPFTLLNPSNETEHLGLGLADTLTTHLSNFPQIIVRPLSAVVKYADTSDSLAAGRELRVQWIVYGSVQFSGERLRVNLQLASVEANRPVWGATFDERLTDILEIQDNISTQVIKLLLPQLTSDEAVAVRPTVDPEAYQMYLRGRFLWNKRTSEGLHKAISYLTQATQKDREYALAYAALADCYLVMVEFDHDNREAHFAAARRAAKQALALNNQLGEALAALAHILFFDDWETVESERLYRRAIEAAPNYGVARHWYSIYLTAMGRFAESFEQLHKGLELDPLSLTMNRNVAAVYFYCGQLDEATEQYEVTLEIEPNYVPALYGLSNIYGERKEFEKAARALDKAHSIAPEKDIVWIGRAKLYVEQNRLDKARDIVSNPPVRFSPFDCALIYNFLGDDANLFRSLEAAVDERDSTVLFLRVHPDFKKLHGDQRFIKLLRRIERTTSETSS